MDVRIDPLLVVTVLLSSIRILTFFLVAPPFAGPTVPIRIKVGLAVALSLLTAVLTLKWFGASTCVAVCTPKHIEETFAESPLAIAANDSTRAAASPV